MKRPIDRARRLAAAALACSLLGGISGSVGYAAPVKVQPRKNFAQRHPNLTSAAAGIAAYKVAKATAAKRKAAGKKLNFAQRHPIMSGVAAAAVTHHVIKKSTPRK